MPAVPRFVTKPPTVADVSLRLPKAWEKFLQACADFIETQTVKSPRQVRFEHVLYYQRCLDSALEEWLELHRRDQAHFIEVWWTESYPGTAPPAWPEDQGEGSAA